MRKIYLLSLISFLFFQNNVDAQSTVDSLRNVWQDEKKNSEVRLDALYRTIWDNYLFNQTDSSQHYCGLMFNLAEEFRDTIHMAEALYLSGIAFNISGDYEKSKQQYDSSMALSVSINNLDGIVIALSNLAVLCEYTGEIDKAIAYSQRSLELLEESGDPTNQMATILGNIGGNYTYQGNYAKAIEYITRSRKLHEKNGDKEGLAQALTESARLHMEIGDTTLALEQFNESIDLCKAIGNDIFEAKNYLLLAMLYNDSDDYNRALEYYKLSLELNKKLGFKSRIGDNHLYIGETYIKLGKLRLAKEELNQALAIFKESEEVAGIIACQIQLGNILLKQGRKSKALQNGNKAMAMARETKNVEAIQHSALLLYEAHKVLGNNIEALRNHELYISLRDSLQSEENQRAVIRQEYSYAYEKQALSDSLEFAKKEAIKDLEIEKRGAVLAKQRWALAGTGVALLLLILLITAIRKGKKRSDELLHNILPEEIAEELKDKGKADARNFDMVSIIFTDFKGFTEASAKMNAEDLVKEINSCFEAFDSIMGKYNIEKIKTIGDAYMAAGGIPVPASDSVKNTILAALEMQEFIVKRKEEQDIKGNTSFEMRVGIHTGPVVAGIVGVKKFQYDIWGDTVNTASRMESSGEVGQVNISQSTYELSKDNPDLAFESRGKIVAKGKGEMEMYFVKLKRQN